MAASLSALSYFLPILSFLFVFLVSYVFLTKTGIFSGSKFVPVFLSFIFGTFFIINTSLVEYVRVTSSWAAVLMVVVFLAIVIFTFTGAKTDVFKANWISYVFAALLLAFFVITSSYVFNWAVNWGEIWDWFYSDWFGLVLLLAIAAAVSFVITKKAK